MGPPSEASRELPRKAFAEPRPGDRATYRIGENVGRVLIAEFRRRVFGERVAFLCPTKQMCSQVAAQTERYGLRALLLSGRQKDYDKAAFLAYQQAKAIGITTYSGVFNANPAIDDAQLLICDDAHAAENYVSNPWTVTLDRRKEENAFLALFAILRPALSENLIHRIENYDPNRRSNLVDLISPISVFEIQRPVQMPRCGRSCSPTRESEA